MADTTARLAELFDAALDADAEWPDTAERGRIALATLGAAVLLGGAGDLFLRRGPFGVGLPLFVATLLGALAWLVRRRGTGVSSTALLLPFPALLFAAAVTWRASAPLAALNVLAALVALALLAAAVYWRDAWSLRAATVGDVAVAMLDAVVQGAFGCLALVLGDVRFADLPFRRGRLPLLRALGRGAVLALPVALLFGTLLATADPAFAALLPGHWFPDVHSLLPHVLTVGFFGWLSAGYLRGALVPGARGRLMRPGRAPELLGAIELSMVLGTLNLLFALFVIVQLRYFYGGAAHVAATAGLTYAEYARHGFFELVAVAALVLPLLLGMHAVLRRDAPLHARAFAALASVLLVLLGAIMTSAMGRMWLYQREYGLTESRLYASAFMGWLAVVFVCFALTVLRGRPTRFVAGALVAAWATVGALDVANPDALVVRVNAERLHDGRRFDPDYVLTLSEDAVPGVLRLLPALDPAARCAAARWSLAQAKPVPAEDWRVWNLGRARARRSVAGRAAELQALGRATECAAR
jgi:hypothetical protein